MYDISTKNIKKGFLSYSLVLVVGIIFLVIFSGVWFSEQTKFNELDSSVMSIGVKVSSHRNSEGTTMYTPTYYYEVDGIQYSCTASTSSSSYPSDKNVKVYYDSKEPAKCMSDYSKTSNNILAFFLIIPLFCIGIAIWNFIKIFKRLKSVKELNKTGKLVKNLSYRLEDTNIVINNRRILRPVVDYRLPSGGVITLYGDADGCVDLVIDENNPDNYFIDYEINQLSGNLPQDFYNISQYNQNNQYGQYNQNNYQ